MERHFVTFYSPGSFVSEQTTKPIDSWDVDKAVEMAQEIVERYNARPFGFQFSTRSRADDELDSHITDRSATYFLGGKIETLEDVRARNDPSERILIANMEGNGWDRIVINTNSWKSTQPLEEGDVVLDVELAPLVEERG